MEALVAAAAFLVGLAIGVAQQRRLWWRAKHARTEIRRIGFVAAVVASGAPAAEVIAVAQVQLRELLGLEHCRFEAQAHGTDLTRLDRTGTLRTTTHRYTHTGFELPRSGVELQVLTRGRPAGRFVLIPREGRGTTLEQRVIAVAIADQVGAALAPFPLTA